MAVRITPVGWIAVLLALGGGALLAFGVALFVYALITVQVVAASTLPPASSTQVLNEMAYIQANWIYVAGLGLVLLVPGLLLGFIGIKRQRVAATGA